MAKDKRTKSRNRLPNKTSNIEAEYDLGKSFSRVRAYTRGAKKSHHNQTTESFIHNDSYQNRSIDNVDETIEDKTFSGSTWTIYTRLDDKLSSFSDKNEEAHTSLRQELDQKIESVNQKCDKKVPLSLFSWIISGIIGAACIIVSIWWVISYDDMRKLPNKIQEINVRVNGLEEHNSIKVEQDSIKQKK